MNTWGALDKKLGNNWNNTNFYEKLKREGKKTKRWAIGEMLYSSYGFSMESKPLGDVKEKFSMKKEERWTTSLYLTKSFISFSTFS